MAYRVECEVCRIVGIECNEHSEPPFADQYDCLACRILGHFCLLHSQLYAEGKMPLKYKRVNL